jgi:hypothetical protein
MPVLLKRYMAILEKSLFVSSCVPARSSLVQPPLKRVKLKVALSSSIALN